MSRYATSYFDWQGVDNYQVAVTMTHFFPLCTKCWTVLCTTSVRSDEKVLEIMEMPPIL